MKKFLAALMVVVMLFTVSVGRLQANADVLTISALSAAAYAMAQQAGLNFTFVGGTASGSQAYMENQLSNWVNSNGGISIFGLTPVKALAAKLAITQTAFLKLKDFINDYITDNSISDVSRRVYGGTINGSELGARNTTFLTEQPTGTTLDSPGWVQIVTTLDQFDSTACYGAMTFRMGFGTSTYKANTGAYSGYTRPLYWEQEFDDVNNSVIVTLWYERWSGNYPSNAPTPQSLSHTFSTANLPQNKLFAVIPNDGVSFPNVGLNDLQTYERQDWASDTNLDQMVEDIFTDTAGNDLILEPETVEEQPQVTPVPTAAPGDIVGGLDTISGQLEGIDNTLAGVQEGVGEAVGQLEGINEGVGSISEALEVPTAIEATSFKFDLTTLFPFCIPFDIYRFVTMFNASPVAPHVQIPFNIPVVGLQYTFDLDFSSFDSVASVLRSVELIAFCVGLAILTSKVIRW